MDGKYRVSRYLAYLGKSPSLLVTVFNDHELSVRARCHGYRTTVKTMLLGT